MKITMRAGYCIFVNNDDWFDDDNHDEVNYDCRRPSEGGRKTEPAAAAEVSEVWQRRQRRQQWQLRGQTTINKEQ